MKDIEGEVELLRFDEEYISFLNIRGWKGGRRVNW